jgi:hypothetical protein
MARKVNFKANKDSKDIPVGIKVISILFYVGAVLCFFMGFAMIISSKAMAISMVASHPGVGLESIPQGMLVTLIVIIGILALGAGIFSFFIGKGIWKLKRWARITAIVLSIIGLISVIISMVMNFKFTNLISFVIDGFIGGYLLFSREAKAAFK